MPLGVANNPRFCLLEAFWEPLQHFWPDNNHSPWASRSRPDTASSEGACCENFRLAPFTYACIKSTACCELSLLSLYSRPQHAHFIPAPLSAYFPLPRFLLSANLNVIPISSQCIPFSMKYFLIYSFPQWFSQTTVPSSLVCTKRKKKKSVLLKKLEYVY